MAELGLTQAADVLLRHGANLNFEGQGEPCGAGVGRWLQWDPVPGGQPGLWALPTVLLEATSLVYFTVVD